MCTRQYLKYLAYVMTNASHHYLYQEFRTERGPKTVGSSYGQPS